MNLLWKLLKFCWILITFWWTIAKHTRASANVTITTNIIIECYSCVVGGCVRGSVLLFVCIGRRWRCRFSRATSSRTYLLHHSFIHYCVIILFYVCCRESTIIVNHIVNKWTSKRWKWLHVCIWFVFIFNHKNFVSFFVV